jgi:hypothetical protein
MNLIQFLWWRITGRKLPPPPKAQKRVAIVLVLALALSGCASNPTPQPPPTPAAQRALTADAIAGRFHEAAAFVILQADAGNIPTSVSRPFVKFCRDTILALDKADASWQLVARSGWNSIRADMQRYPVLAPWLRTIDTLVGRD